MATKPLFGLSGWLYDFQSQRDFRLPCAWWPVLLTESRTPSILLWQYRFTIAFWNWRWSWVLLHRYPEPTMPLSDPSLAIDEWIEWSVKWSRGKLSAEDLRSLLRQSDAPWSRLVRLKAANYHYGRLILAREALSLMRATSPPVSKTTKNEDMELPEIDFSGVSSVKNADRRMLRDE